MVDGLRGRGGGCLPDSVTIDPELGRRSACGLGGRAGECLWGSDVIFARLAARLLSDGDKYMCGLLATCTSSLKSMRSSSGDVEKCFTEPGEVAIRSGKMGRLVRPSSRNLPATCASGLMLRLACRVSSSMSCNDAAMAALKSESS